MNIYKMDFLNSIFIIFVVNSIVFIAHAEQLPLENGSSFDTQQNRLSESGLETDDINAIELRKNAFSSLFKPLYVVKGPLTDCSFVSAFMLMTNNDPDYPYKILKYNNGAYFVKYPGLDEEIKVSEKELEKFYKTIEISQTEDNFKQKGYTPRGMEILRAAYYEYQRKKGLRSPRYRVYGGGQPIQDLMVLSGVRRGGKIIAVQGYDQTPPERISFANGLEQKIKVKLQDGIFIYKNDGYSDEVLDPFSILSDELSSYLVSVSSVRDIGFFANLFGKRIVENHAYYFLGFDPQGNYILGDAYNTKEPVHIGKQEFLEKFNGIYYVKIPAN